MPSPMSSTWAGGPRPVYGAVPFKAKGQADLRSPEQKRAQALFNVKHGLIREDDPRLADLGIGADGGGKPQGGYGGHGFRPQPSEPRKPIKGFSRKAHGLPDFGGLAEKEQQALMPMGQGFYQGPGHAASAGQIAAEKARHGLTSGYGGMPLFNGKPIQQAPTPAQPDQPAPSWAQVGYNEPDWAASAPMSGGPEIGADPWQPKPLGGMDPNYKFKAIGGPAIGPTNLNELGPEPIILPDGRVTVAGGGQPGLYQLPVQSTVIPAAPPTFASLPSNFNDSGDPLAMSAFGGPASGAMAATRQAFQGTEGKLALGKIMMGQAEKRADQAQGYARQDQLYQRDRADQLTDKEALKKQKDADAALHNKATMAGYQAMLDGYTKDGSLTAADIETLDHAPDDETRIAIAQALTKQGSARQSKAEEAKQEAEKQRLMWTPRTIDMGDGTKVTAIGNQIIQRPVKTSTPLTPEQMKASGLKVKGYDQGTGEWSYGPDDDGMKYDEYEVPGGLNGPKIVKVQKGSTPPTNGKLITNRSGATAAPKASSLPPSITFGKKPAPAP